MKRSVVSCFMFRNSMDNKKRSCALTVLRWRLCALQDHRHTTSVAQQDGLSTDRIWTDDGKRRQRGEPHDVLNGIIDREKDASRVCFLHSGTDGTS